MSKRMSKAFRRLVLISASLPLMQFGGCAGDFAASAIATETTARVSSVLFTSLETVLLNTFGV